MSPAPRFSNRVLTTLTLAVSLFILIVSSLVLYVMPAGRDAYWTRWTLLGLDKDRWDALHTVGGFLFLIAGIVHLILNWKAFWHYVASGISKTRHRKIELAAAIALNAVVTVLCILLWPPASTIMDWSHDLKAAWVRPGERAPYPHAELATIEELSKQAQWDIGAVVSALQAKGLVLEPAKTLGENARANHRTPADLYGMLAEVAPKAAATGPDETPIPIAPLQEGMGWGRKTVKEVCLELGVPLTEGMENLKKAGIKPNAETTLRELADGASMTPIEVAETLRGTHRSQTE